MYECGEAFSDYLYLIVTCTINIVDYIYFFRYDDYRWKKIKEVQIKINVAANVSNFLLSWL